MTRDGALPGWPMMLRREMAATYCGMSPSTFDTEVKAGRIPGPVQTTESLKAWRRADLEIWAEGLRAAQAIPVNPWDEP